MLLIVCEWSHAEVGFLAQSALEPHHDCKEAMSPHHSSTRRGEPGQQMLVPDHDQSYEDNDSNVIDADTVV